MNQNITSAPALIPVTLYIPVASHDWMTRAAELEHSRDLEDFILISAWRSAYKILIENRIAPHCVLLPPYNAVIPQNKRP